MKLFYPTTAARSGKTRMADLLWISVMAGLVAATLAYARLCDNA